MSTDRADSWDPSDMYREMQGRAAKAPEPGLSATESGERGEVVGEVADSDVETLGRTIVVAWMAHLGYTAEEITTAEQPRDHSKCEHGGELGWFCSDEDEQPRHPIHDEMDLFAEVVMFALDHPALAGRFAAAETRGRQWAATWLESDVAHAVLIAHSKFRIQDCRCGHAELGKSHTAHVLRELAAAMKEESGEPADSTITKENGS